MFSSVAFGHFKFVERSLRYNIILRYYCRGGGSKSKKAIKQTGTLNYRRFKRICRNITVSLNYGLDKVSLIYNLGTVTEGR